MDFKQISLPFSLKNSLQHEWPGMAICVVEKMFGWWGFLLLLWGMGNDHARALENGCRL